MDEDHFASPRSHHRDDESVSIIRNPTLAGSYNKRPSLWKSRLAIIPQPDLKKSDEEEDKNFASKKLRNYPWLYYYFAFIPIYVSPFAWSIFRFLWPLVFFALVVCDDITNIVCFTVSDISIITGFLSLFIIVYSFFFLMYSMRKGILANALERTERVRGSLPGTMAPNHLIQTYVLIGALCAIIASVGGSFAGQRLWFLDTYACQPKDVMFPVLVVGKVAYFFLLWTVLFLNSLQCHLYIHLIDAFKCNLVNGEYASIKEAMLAHLKVVTDLENCNKHMERFLVLSCAANITGLILNLYGILAGYENLIFWYLTKFSIFTLSMILILLPGALVTRRARHIVKRANRIRAVVDENVGPAMDSFLLYLQTSNVVWKLGGVEISIGFVTKVCLTVFTICAFVVQRALSTPSKGVLA